MKSRWYYTLNKFEICGEDKALTLDTILSQIGKKEQKFSLNNEFNTIRYISDLEFEDKVYFYVEPEFTASHIDSDNARFLIFSAPGATGKTALSRYICHSLNGIYWDLPDSKVAEYSFQGALTKAIGYKNLSDFVEDINNQKVLLVIDAFDEAEAGSGRTGIEFFLRDLSAVTDGCNGACAVLMARTESAIFIKKYFNENSISYQHYEVGYFTDENAKRYIENRLRKKKLDVTQVVRDCIDKQFDEIHSIFLRGTDEESAGFDAKEFLGYAPVLDALAASYSDERNTANLLKKTTDGANNCALMVDILQSLLTREQSKFSKALRNKLSALAVEIDYARVYMSDEQLCRIIGWILFQDSQLFGNVSNTVHMDCIDEYFEVIGTQLPQHPFVMAKGEDNVIYDFTGPAFKDYVVAYGLADEDMFEYVREFLVSAGKYCPSQMLIEFYAYLSKHKIRGRDIPLMYQSFKAHAHIEDTVSLYISGNGDECYVEFRLLRSDNKDLTIYFDVIDPADGIYMSQLSDCYIDFEGIVYVGNATGEARIDNSVVICDELVWCSSQILIEAYAPGICVLAAGTLVSSPGVTPRFEVKTDHKHNLRISANNVDSFYKLIPYKSNDIFVDGQENERVLFATSVRRILCCLRCHSKDTPARKMDFIDNRIIGLSNKKKRILEFLLSAGILFTDEQNWLYKLDLNKLSAYSLKWNDVKNGDFSSIHALYDAYAEST